MVSKLGGLNRNTSSWKREFQETTQERTTLTRQLNVKIFLIET